MVAGIVQLVTSFFCKEPPPPVRQRKVVVEQSKPVLLAKRIEGALRWRDYPYQVEEILGEGSFGFAFSVHFDRTPPDIPVYQRVVLKVSKKDATSLKSMRREIRVLRHLSHPGHPAIVALFGVLEGPEDRLGIILEKGGISLRKLQGWRRSGYGIQLPRFRSLANQMLSGLSYMHKVGVVHGDLHSGNVLIDTTCEPWGLKIIDAGCAYFVRELQVPDFYIEQPSDVAAPEVAWRLPLTPALDLWSAACIFLYLSTGLPLIPRDIAKGRTDPNPYVSQLWFYHFGSPPTALFERNADFLRRIQKEAKQLPPLNPEPLSLSKRMTRVAGASKEDRQHLLTIFQQLFQYRASQRPSAQELLRHPFFVLSAI